jgi:hypothetical protein
MFLDYLRTATERDSQWLDVMQPLFVEGHDESGIHIAILVEPYLQFVLDGTKTVESRFSRNGCAPFEKVRSGDVVLLKRQSGPIVGACALSDVWNYRLTPETLDDIRTRFGSAIQPQRGFWEDRANAAYATLMGVADVRSLPELHIPKRDRRGWVVVRGGRVGVAADF